MTRQPKPAIEEVSAKNTPTEHDELCVVLDGKRIEAGTSNRRSVLDIDYYGEQRTNRHSLRKIRF